MGAVKVIDRSLRYYSHADVNRIIRIFKAENKVLKSKITHYEDVMRKALGGQNTYKIIRDTLAKEQGHE